MYVSVSFLSDNYNAEELIKEINKSNCDYIHVDVMDGKFVKNKNYTMGEFKKLLSKVSKPLDVHLMVSNPKKYIKSFSLLNTEYITFHIEAVSNVMELINEIKNCGIKCGISVKPNTNIKKIFPYLKYIDQVLIMSVNPGRSGQTFKESILYKIEVLKKTIEMNKLNIIISVDGGINVETALLVKQKGSDMIVSASYVHNGDIIKNIETLKQL